MTQIRNRHKCLEEIQAFLYQRFWDKKARWPVYIDPDEKLHKWSRYTHAEAACGIKDLLDTDPDIWFDSWLLLRRYWDRLRRYRARMKEMMKERCLFVRLSWNDESLAKLSPETRHKYVSDWCAAHSDSYLANIDFGDEHDREHYHVVMRYPDNLDKNDCGWPYGYVGVRYVRGSGCAAEAEIDDLDVEESCRRLTWYSTKLSFHALKGTTKQNKPIFSRKRKSK